MTPVKKNDNKHETIGFGSTKMMKSMAEMDPNEKRKSEKYGRLGVIGCIVAIVLLAIIDPFLPVDMGWRPYIALSVAAFISFFLWNPIAAAGGLPRLLKAGGEFAGRFLPHRRNNRTNVDAAQDKEIAQLREQVRALTDRRSGEDVGYNGPERRSGTRRSQPGGD